MLPRSTRAQSRTVTNGRRKGINRVPINNSLAYDSFFEEFHCGRELVGPWAMRVKSLREEQALLADARRERAERRQAEEEAARAEEERRVTE